MIVMVLRYTNALEDLQLIALSVPEVINLILIITYLHQYINHSSDMKKIQFSINNKVFIIHYMFYFKPWIIVSFYFRNLIVDVLLEET